MIPKIIHYCWMGGAPLPPLAEECMASWKKFMPEWEYMRWDEDSLTQALMKEPIPGPYPKGKGEMRSWLDYMPKYVQQAYEARKFAFVSDYVRLWALEQYGGLYMDVDFLVHRSFEDLMDQYPAFAGVEGCKRQAVMMGVIASEPHGAWIRDMKSTYESREFIKPDGTFDLTPNTSFFSNRLEAQGYIPDGQEKDFFFKNEGVSELESEGVFMLHVFPVHYFCPVLTTGEDVRTPETYCEHKGLRSWNTHISWKETLMTIMGPKWKTRLIKMKRKILG